MDDNQLSMKKIVTITVLFLVIAMVFISGCINLSETASPEVEINESKENCAGESESCCSYLPNVPAPPSCCEGLTQISQAELYEGKCIIPTGSFSVCTKCGDSVCSIGENECNCPKDCE